LRPDRELAAGAGGIYRVDRAFDHATTKRVLHIGGGVRLSPQEFTVSLIVGEEEFAALAAAKPVAAQLRMLRFHLEDALAGCRSRRRRSETRLRR